MVKAEHALEIEGPMTAKRQAEDKSETCTIKSDCPFRCVQLA